LDRSCFASDSFTSASFFSGADSFSIKEFGATGRKDSVESIKEDFGAEEGIPRSGSAADVEGFGDVPTHAFRQRDAIPKAETSRKIFID
jgi:hypothetical protein